MTLRSRAAAAGVTDITQKGDSIQITMSVFDFGAVSAVTAEDAWKNRLRFLPKADKPILMLKMMKTDQPLKLMEQFVDIYRRYHAT